ncbi:MAG: NAD(P)/FAD-dependent oxidoreductase [Spirochaetales bacterium]|nr:NAD(P)/FAD-dependent oxidoreductase [Spirochaetales bacterium]
MQDSFDVAVIGAGVTGAAIARRLSEYKLDVALLEKECDVSFGVSKANSGIIHGGFHHSGSTLKGRLEIRGNRMFDQLENELHFPFRRCGILIAAFSTEEMKQVESLYAQGVANQAIGIELCNSDRMLALEPKLNHDVVGGLHAPSGGIIEPYRFVFALVESALKNGVRLITEFEVDRAGRTGDLYDIYAGDRGIKARYVVNAAGLFADKVSKLFGAEEYTIIPRKGEEYLMDREAAALPSRVIFPVPSRVSKGMLVIPTAEGTTMLGPTAEQTGDKTDVSTSEENFERIFYSARRLIPSVSERDIITSFAGVRPTLPENDFFIAVSERRPHFIQAAGIQSPGLTASPAIADYVKDLLKRDGLVLEEDPHYDPEIEPVQRIRNLDIEAIDRLIERDPGYGEIICRCESVSRAEIIDAVRKGHTTLDGVKFYTRAQMGRCQGGFCTFRILKIISEETGIPIDRITKRGRGSYIVGGRIGDFDVAGAGTGRV